MSSLTTMISSPFFEIFYRQYRKPILIVSCLIVTLSFIIGGILFWKRLERLDAENLLSHASSIEQWRVLVDRYPRSQASANALLLIAGAQSQKKQWEASCKTYREFLKYFPHHPLAISSYIGIAMNKDATGNSQEALSALQQAVAGYPKAYGAPEALLFEAKIMTRLGKKEEANRLLQTIMTQYPDSLVSTLVLKQREKPPQ